MSEKEKEEVILDHSAHVHPLILTKSASIDGADQWCYGCGRYIFSGETIYRCRDKCSHLTLDEACAELPAEITFSLHPQHTLVQRELKTWSRLLCAICGYSIFGIGYYCSSSSDSCDFHIHLGCAHSMDVMAAAASGCTKHPSHPHHELTLLWKPGRAASLRCDACGAIHRGNSYFCTLCQYCISDSCAALPATLDRHHLHDHPLSLVYRFPLEYFKYSFSCDVCLKEFHPRYWVYHCGICRYVAHINCAISTPPFIMSNINVDANVNVFPIKDAAEELIGPFVAKLGVTTISHDNEIIKGNYKFHNPNHLLRLISSSLHDPEENDHDDDDDEDDADLNYGLKGKLVCDGCTTPISSSNKYISCGECKYFLHLSCFQLPQELPPHPLHKEPHHILSLQAPPKLDFVLCNICRFHTNGLFYQCKSCDFRVDIKCASLPDTIKHVAHPHHHLNLVAPETPMGGMYSFFHNCSACGGHTYDEAYYNCDVCQIRLHSKCAMLPPQVSNRRWDKHVLPLTYNASINHPSSFYCEVCEKEMHPKRWMYHCSECDVSIHPKCLPTTSGEHRNIKFGQRYDSGALHHHHVAHQLTNRLRCSVCGERKVHGTRGFQCDSHKCDFFMCLDHCGEDDEDVLHAID